MKKKLEVYTAIARSEEVKIRELSINDLSHQFNVDYSQKHEVKALHSPRISRILHQLSQSTAVTLTTVKALFRSYFKSPFVYIACLQLGVKLHLPPLSPAICYMNASFWQTKPELNGERFSGKWSARSFFAKQRWPWREMADDQ